MGADKTEGRRFSFPLVGEIQEATFEDRIFMIFLTKKSSFLLATKYKQDYIWISYTALADRTATMNPVLICLLVMVTFFFLLCDAARTGLAQGRAISPTP